MEYGLKDIVFYVQKHIAHRIVCYNFPLVHNKPLGAPVFVKLVYCFSVFRTFDSIATADGCVPNETIAWAIRMKSFFYDKYTLVSSL